MLVKAYIDNTTLDATKAMINDIDYSDFSVEHIIVVPDRFSLLMEKLLLSTLKNKALFNVKVLGLTSLASYLFDKLGKKVEILSSAECLLLTKQAIDKVKSEFKTFKKNSINFCFEINKIISQLKSSSVYPEDLKEVDSLSGAKYHDIKLIYCQYQKLLADKYDANERLNLLINELEDCKELQSTKFYFAQFDSFTAEGYSLIKTLIKIASSVCVGLAMPKSIGNDYIYEKDIYQKFKAISKELDIQIESVYHNSEYLPAKEAIVSGLYGYQSVYTANNGFYSCYSCQNIYDEITSVAKLIHYLVFNGYRFKDIVIACDLSHKEKLENIFDKFNIPHFIDSSVTADQTILARLIFDILETVYFLYPSTKLLSLAKNKLISEDEEIVNIIQKFNINNKHKYKKHLAKIFACDKFFHKVEQCKNASQFKELIMQILQEMQDKYDSILLDLEVKGYVKERDINRQSKDIICQSLELIEKYSYEDISLGEYIKTLKLLLSFKDVLAVPSQADGVMVGDASASYFGECKILIMLGCENLPAQSSDSGLLNDYDLTQSFIEKKIEPTIRMINRRNRFKLFNLLTLPNEHLFCFMKQFNEEGKKNDLPVFIESLNKIFSQKVIRSQSVFHSSSDFNNQNDLIRFGNRANFIEEYNKKLSQDNLFKLDIKNDIETQSKDFVKDAKNLFFKNNRVSVTQLEEYFSCPFKHLVRHGQKLKKNESSEFHARDIGNICHKGAELFVKELIDKSVENIDIKIFIEKNFDFIVKDLKIEEKLENSSEKKSLVAFFKHQLNSVLSDIVKEVKQSYFAPKFVEKKIDNIIFGSLAMSGKIDRIDEYKQYFRIIDYKSGKTGNILKQLYYGEKLQLFLYQRVVRTMLNKQSAGVFYFNAKLDYLKNSEEKQLLSGLSSDNEEVLKLYDKDIDFRPSSIVALYKNNKGEFKGSIIAKENLQIYEDYAYKIASRAIQEIQSGYIQPKPNENSCQFCKYASICLYEKINGTRGNLKVESFEEILKDEANTRATENT